MSAGAPEHTTVGHARDRSLDTRARTRGRAIARSAPIATIGIHPRDFAHRSACELACGWLRFALRWVLAHRRFAHLRSLLRASQLPQRGVAGLWGHRAVPARRGRGRGLAHPCCTTSATVRWPRFVPRVRAPSASGLGAHPCHICAGTGLDPATSAPGLGSTLPFRFGNHPRSPHPMCSNVTRYSQGGGMVV